MRSFVIFLIASSISCVDSLCSPRLTEEVGRAAFFSSSRLAKVAHGTPPGSICASPVMGLRGGAVVEPAELVAASYDWAVNLGAPAALVAGAVVATMYENVRGGELEVLSTDSRYSKFAKRLTTYLLITSFAMQIVSIFVTTVTGTVLLSRDASIAAESSKLVSRSALEYLKNNFEFEYLTSRLSFLQGLLNWLGAVAVEHTIRRPEEGPYTRKVNMFIASSFGTLILFILSFYNGHMTFYENYPHMVCRWCAVAFRRFFLQWRPMAVAYVPSLIATLVLGFQAFQELPSKLGKEKDDKLE